MNDLIFQRACFEVAPDSNSIRGMEDAFSYHIQGELHGAILERIQEIIRLLNEMGHRLKVEYEPQPGDISYRDDWWEGDAYRCRLRVGVDVIVSVVYNRRP